MTSPSWQQVHADFLLGAKAYPDLFAHWGSKEELWTLRYHQPGKIPDLEAERLFRDIARVAVLLLGKPIDERPPWHTWLDLMRQQKRGFHRIKLATSFKVFRNAAEGKGTPGTSGRRLLDDGTIAHVFAESATFCADIELQIQMRERSAGTSVSHGDRGLDEQSTSALGAAALRANALGVLSDLLLRTKNSLPEKNPYPEDDPRHAWWRGVVGDVAKHQSDLAKRFPVDDPDPRQYDGWALDVLKAFFIASAIEKQISIQIESAESLAAYYDYLDSLSGCIVEIGEHIAPHLTPMFMATLRSRVTKWREGIKATVTAGPSSQTSARDSRWRERAKGVVLAPGTAPASSSPERQQAAQSPEPIGDRRKAVDTYIEEVFSRTGKRITRTDIWKSARYKSRTEFERWERNDPKNPNKSAHERFTRILIDKPHLK